MCGAGRSSSLAVAAIAVFLIVDASFFCANLLKIAEGGWLPLTFRRRPVRRHGHLASRHRRDARRADADARMPHSIFVGSQVRRDYPRRRHHGVF